MDSPEKRLRRDDVYVRNMRALFGADPRLAQRIDEVEDDGSVVVEASRQGAPTASVLQAGTNRRMHLHSRVDPEAEGKRFAEAVEVGESFCYVVGGFGLGYHLLALAGRLKGDAFLIVTEPNLQLLKAAMESVDLASLFEKERCLILTSTDKSDVQTMLEPHNNLIMLGTQFVRHATSERLNGEFQAAMRKLIADHMTFCRMNLVTLVANSRITCRNVLNNLPTYLSTPPIDLLRDRFRARPGIVVSAGPSLRKNIDTLARLKGRAVTIAVQTTYKTLLERGIVPDFVTSLDYHEMSRRHFEGITDFGGTHLVAEPKVTWHVPDMYGGPISMLNNEFANMCVRRGLAARDGLKAGATVAHLAFYLAVYMGCDPIIMVGQDLAYTDHVYYAPGVAYHAMWRPELNRFSTIEMKEWERIVRHRRILMKVKDIYENDIYTDEQLFSYLQQFEADFSASQRRVIDATEGGVHKAGTEPMPLAQVERLHCTEPIPAESFAYRQQVRWRDPSRLEAGRKEIEQRMDETDRMVETCRKMVAVLNELTTLVDQPEVFNRRIAEVDDLRVEIHRHEQTYAMVSQMAQHAELQRYSADRRIRMADLDEKGRARRQLQRDIRFVEAIIEGAEALREILGECLGRFDEAMNKA